MGKWTDGSLEDVARLIDPEAFEDTPYHGSSTYAYRRESAYRRARGYLDSLEIAFDTTHQAGIRQGRVKELLAVAEWCEAEAAEQENYRIRAVANGNEQRALEMKCRSQGLDACATHCRAEAAELASEGDAIEDKSNE
jgi:hypothetical protein